MRPKTCVITMAPLLLRMHIILKLIKKQSKVVLIIIIGYFFLSHSWLILTKNMLFDKCLKDLLVLKCMIYFIKIYL